MLKKYQQNAVDFIEKKQTVALFLGMGMGKTVIVLTALQKLIQNGKVKKVIIIAPTKVANAVWKQEVEKWAHIEHIKANICTGTPRNREKMLKDDTANVYVVSAHCLEWLIENNLWDFDCFVIDESTMFKNSKAKKFRTFANMLRENKNTINYRVLLTGTPAPNSLIDLWSQIYILDYGHRLGKFKKDFLKMYFNCEMRTNKIRQFPTWEIKYGMEEAIYKAINDICLHIDKNDIKEELEKEEGYKVIQHNEMLSFSDDTIRQYKHFIKNRVIKTKDEVIITAETPGILVNKLQQFTSGAIYTNGTDTSFQEINSFKINHLKNIVDNSNENIIVAIKYKHEKDRILKLIKEAVELKSNAEIDAWNCGKIRVLIVHPQSCGHGLNLQFGGSKLVWYSLPWSLEQYMQTNARLTRIGQKKDVVIKYLLVENTVDEKILEALERKCATQQEFLDYVTKSL